MPLSNSLAVAEQPRIEFLLQQDRQGDFRQRMEAIRHGKDTFYDSPQKERAFSLNSQSIISFSLVGQVIVSKVFIGNSMPFRDGDLGDISRYPKVYSVYRNVDAKSKPPASDGIQVIVWYIKTFLYRSVFLHLFVFHSSI